MKNLITPVVAIICIAAMQMWAMAHGHDGLILVSSIAVIAGIAGYKVPDLINQIKNSQSKKNSDDTEIKKG